MGKKRYSRTTGAENILRKELGFVGSSGPVERQLWCAVIWRAVLDYVEPPGTLRQRNNLRASAKEYFESEEFLADCEHVSDGDGSDLAEIIRVHLGIAPTDKTPAYYRDDVEQATITT